MSVNELDIIMVITSKQKELQIQKNCSLLVIFRKLPNTDILRSLLTKACLISKACLIRQPLPYLNDGRSIV